MYIPGYLFLIHITDGKTVERACMGVFLSGRVFCSSIIPS